MPFADSNGTRIAFEVTGSGDPILLIQGLGFTGEMWYRVVPLLAAHGLQVITFDNRGVGDTGPGSGSWTIEDMADDAAAVLTASGHQSAHVLGISMGGVILQQFAAVHADRARSFIFSSTSCNDPAVAVPMPAEVASVLINRTAMTPRESVEATIPFAYASTTPREWIEEDTQRRLDRQITNEGYMGQLGAVAGYAASIERLRAIDKPTLVIHGREDRMVLVDNAEIIAEAIPGSELTIFEGSSHVLMTDIPQRFADTVAAFVRRVG